MVSTPIGNLEDLSFRALRILKEVDLVLCEDTRVTKKLLSHYDVRVDTMSYHQHSDVGVMEGILANLEEGKNLAMVTDAGTPGVSDPGNELIQYLAERNPDINIVPIPGPSAVAAIASIAGIPTDRFVFLGYPPAKNKRKKYFQSVVDSEYPVIFYESPHRILKTLKELEEIDGDLSLVVGRELTKKFERVYRGNIKDIQEELGTDGIKGEFVVIVGT